MSDSLYNVLFLCTGNSARSIMAEALLNHWGQGRFQGFSAGSFPTGMVNPLAIQLLEHLGIQMDNPRSKSWDEFAAADAPTFDCIITVCDNAADEVCPIWPGHPVTAHWGVPDPAAVEGSDEYKMRAFRDVAMTLEARIKLLLSLPISKLAKMNLKDHLNEIGET